MALHAQRTMNRTPGPLMRDLILSIVAFLLFYAMLSLLVLWALPASTIRVFPSVILGTGLSLLSAIDARSYRLPDALTLPLLVAGLLLSWSTDGAPPWWHAASAIIGFAVMAGLAHAYRYMRGRSGLGLGDAKLLAASGAWVGAEALPTVLLWASGAAIAGLLVLLVRGRKVSPTSRIPFGPFLALGTWLVWVCGPL